MSEGKYEACEIQILTGLEAIRKRPGMWLGNVNDDSGPHHLCMELVANAVDEFLAGRATRIDCHVEGGTFTIQDDGRGIPVAVPDGEDLPFVTLAFTRLHFKPTMDGHHPHVHCVESLLGVGLPCITALSSKAEVWVGNGDQCHHQVFLRETDVSELTTSRKPGFQGTRVSFTLDPEIFEVPVINVEKLAENLRNLAYLNPGLRLSLNGEVLFAPGGLRDLVIEQLLEESLPPLDGIFHCRGAIPVETVPWRLRGSDSPQKTVMADVLVEAVLCWADTGKKGGSRESSIWSFVGCAPTRDGGTHLQGLHAAIVRALGQEIPKQNLEAAEEGEVEVGAAEPGEEKENAITPILSEPILSGLVGAVHVLPLDPEFGGPTKDRLVSPECYHAVVEFVTPRLIEWLEERPELRRRLFAANEARFAGRAEKRHD